MSPLRIHAIVLAALLLLAPVAFAKPGDGNRLTYLDGSDPYYVSRTFPKLTTPPRGGEDGVAAAVTRTLPKLATPQGVGEDAADAAAILAASDMRPPARNGAGARPCRNRLKQIDGRAPVSIMTNQVKPDDPRLTAWLKEGLS